MERPVSNTKSKMMMNAIEIPYPMCVGLNVVYVDGCRLERPAIINSIIDVGTGKIEIIYFEDGKWISEIAKYSGDQEKASWHHVGE